MACALTLFRWAAGSTPRCATPSTSLPTPTAASACTPRPPVRQQQVAWEQGRRQGRGAGQHTGPGSGSSYQSRTVQGNCVIPELLSQGSLVPLYVAAGVYREGCGLGGVLMSWGAGEYVHMVLRLNRVPLPPEALFCVRSAQLRGGVLDRWTMAGQSGHCALRAPPETAQQAGFGSTAWLGKFRGPGALTPAPMCPSPVQAPKAAVRVPVGQPLPRVAVRV